MKCYSSDSIPVLSKLAMEYTLFDNWRSSVPGPTWPNRFFVHATTSHGYCDDDFRIYSMEPIYKRLTDKGISWKIYHNDLIAQSWAIEYVASHLGNSKRLDNLFADLENNSLPQYSFIEPNYHTFAISGEQNDMHPDSDVGAGDNLVNSIFQALTKSPYWSTSALIITFDEHGGIYDHVSPQVPLPQPDDYEEIKYKYKFDISGLRVPTIVVSPFVKSGFVDHNLYDHTSILKTIEERFALDALTKRDANARSFSDVFSEVPTSIVL